MVLVPAVSASIYLLILATLAKSDLGNIPLGSGNYHSYVIIIIRTVIVVNMYSAYSALDVELIFVNKIGNLSW